MKVSSVFCQGRSKRRLNFVLQTVRDQNAGKHAPEVYKTNACKMQWIFGLYRQGIHAPRIWPSLLIYMDTRQMSYSANITTER